MSKQTAAATATPKPSKKSEKGGAEVTLIPAFKDPKTGKVLLAKEVVVDEETGKERTRIRPLRLKPKQFPKTRDGRKAYCEYQVLMWTWKGENVSLTGADPVAKKERALERLLKKAEAMRAELAADKAGATK